MKIIKMAIHNFRGLDFECDGVNDRTLFIGHNDAGKSNICSAIMKVLSPEYRRRPLFSSDSSFSNNQDISFFFTLDLQGLTVAQKSKLHAYIYHFYNESGERYDFMDVRMVCKYNVDTMLYEDELFFGQRDIEELPIQLNRQNDLDKILSVVYIHATYDLATEKKNYFNYKDIKKIDNQIAISPGIKDSIKSLQDSVKDEAVFEDVRNDLDDMGGFEMIFDGMKFGLAPNIKIENIFNSLDILNYDGDNQIDNIGDGKSKMLSTMLKFKTVDDDKSVILIVEEPENHLYVLLQKYYLSTLERINPDQLLITSHSPYIVDFEKINKIIKISKICDENNCLMTKPYYFNVNSDDFKEFGYLINTEISEMIYYDTVVLLEGYSEKYFYNLLSIKDKRFRDYLIKERIGLYTIGGIAFETTKKLLTSLGIKVYIKTDNDITGIKNSENYRYTGLLRIYKYLSEENKKKMLDVYSLESEDSLKDFLTCEDGKRVIDKVEENMDAVIRICQDDNVLLSNHHNGFEEDFLNYLGMGGADFEKEMKYLKSAKLMNLHEYITENNIDIKITENNKNSVLLGFVNVDEIFE